MVILDRSVLENLVTVLRENGYQVIGPKKRGAAIVLEELHSAAELPAGIADVQTPGSYRTSQREDGAIFGHTVSPQSWKQFLFPPVLQLMSIQRAGKTLDIGTSLNGHRKKNEMKDEPPPLAFLGMRPCDLSALLLQDRVFAGGQIVDPLYKQVRDRLFIVAVNCSSAGGTCFCASMGTGPRAKGGFDVVLTEVLRERAHHFIAEAGTERGRKLLERLPHRPAGQADKEEIEKIAGRVTGSMGRTLKTESLKAIFSDGFEHPRWEQVARRCLACANCTLVCPTCFCHTIEDVTNLTGTQAERVRKWDSCFTQEFTYIHGGSVRPSVRSRYRQWMTHKLSTWTDQFGTPGCVGCGRCITWCPVGIDITEEARVMLEQTLTPSTPS